MIYTLTPLACEYRINYSNQLGQVGVAVASAASNIVPAGGVDAHIEQSAGQLATDASRSTAALATKLMEDGIDTATRAVERSIVATVPLVQSAEELSAQYVVPLGDRIAGSKTINDAIDAAATTIESGFQRAQGPVARLEGLVLHYVAAPLDKRLGQFSAWADKQTPATLATGVSGWARQKAVSASSYLGDSLRSRWGGKAVAPPEEAAAAAAAAAADQPADAGEFLAERLPPPEALPPLQDPAGQL